MNLKPELGKHDCVLPFTSRSVRREKDAAEFCVCTFFFFGLENTLLLFSSEILEKSDGQTECKSTTGAPVY